MENILEEEKKQVGGNKKTKTWKKLNKLLKDVEEKVGQVKGKEIYLSC